MRNPARYMDATRCRKLHDLRTSPQMPTSTAYKPAFRRTPPHAKPPPPPPPRRWTSPLSTLLAVAAATTAATKMDVTAVDAAGGGRRHHRRHEDGRHRFRRCWRWRRSGVCRSACGGGKAKAFLNSAGVWPRIVVEDESNRCNTMIHSYSIFRISCCVHCPTEKLQVGKPKSSDDGCTPRLACSFHSSAVASVLSSS